MKGMVWLIIWFGSVYGSTRFMGERGLGAALLVGAAAWAVLDVACRPRPGRAR